MTGISVIDRTTAMTLTVQSLGLPAGATSRVLIAQSLRRTVFIAAPCTHRAARDLAMSALGPLTGDDEQALKERIDQGLEDLLSMGDVLEMRQDPNLDEGCVLRPAPPAFVRRRDNSFAILGVAGEEITPSLQAHIVHCASGLRTINSPDAEACRTMLLDLGVIELPERIWLHAPTATSAPDHIKSWIARLPGDAKPEKLGEVEILDTALPVSFYKGRWSALNNQHAGIFIARRPQRFGAKLWSLVEVHGGIIQRFIDIHPNDSRFRPCDEAWRLQAAFDAVAGSPQKVAIVVGGSAATFSFFSPLPAWAERRLCIVGERVDSRGALFAFEIPAGSAEEEFRWLADALWLVPVEGGTK